MDSENKLPFQLSWVKARETESLDGTLNFRSTSDPIANVNTHVLKLRAEMNDSGPLSAPIKGSSNTERKDDATEMFPVRRAKHYGTVHGATPGQSGPWRYRKSFDEHRLSSVSELSETQGRRDAMHSIRQMSEMPLGRPLDPPNETLEQLHPGSTSRGDFHSDPMTTTWNEKIGYSKDFVAIAPPWERPGAIYHQRVPLWARKGNTRGGVRNPPKRVSDDIRTQVHTSAGTRAPSTLETPRWVGTYSTSLPTASNTDLQPASHQTTEMGSFASSAQTTAEKLPEDSTFRSQMEGLNTGDQQKIPRFEPRSDRVSKETHTYPGPLIAHGRSSPENHFPSQGLPVSGSLRHQDHPEPQTLMHPQARFSGTAVEIGPQMYSNPSLQQVDPESFTRIPYSGHPMIYNQPGTLFNTRDPLARVTNTLLPHEQQNRQHQRQPSKPESDDDNNKLYIKGFPLQFDIAAICHLLRPCRGLLHVTDPRRSNEGASALFVFAT